MMSCNTVSFYHKAALLLLKALFLFLDMVTGDIKIYFNPLQSYFISLGGICDGNLQDPLNGCVGRSFILILRPSENMSEQKVITNFT